MALIIDGYNLLHASGILGRGRGPGFLERSRQALLNFLAESLDEKTLARCTVVFDASIENAPKGLPRKVTHRGIAVHFASGMPSADEHIEQLILEDSSPRKLTVVSSDHRLHRAAKRRKATPIDSDIWFRDTVRARASRQQSAENLQSKPLPPSSQHEIQFWLNSFGIEVEQTSESSPPASPENPFPPGYADDLFDD